MTRSISWRRALLGAAATLGVAAGLSACGGGGSSGSSTGVSGTTAPTPAAKLEDSFGVGFGVDYRVAANSEPVHPTSSDINPVDPTREPIQLH